MGSDTYFGRFCFDRYFTCILWWTFELWPYHTEVILPANNRDVVTLTPLKYCHINQETKGFFQIEIIINVLVSYYFRFIWISMLWDYGHNKFATLSVRGSTLDVRFWRLKSTPHWKGSPKPYPANTRRWTNVGLMLGQRRRRWANINPTLVQRLVFAG